MLKGLNFYKDKQDPVAMADEEYPAWLWGVLEAKGGEGMGGKVDEGDLYGMFYLLLLFKNCYYFHCFLSVVYVCVCGCFG